MMFRMMFRMMFWIGLKLMRASGAKVHVLPPGETYPPLPPLVAFHVTCPDRGWTYSYNTEPEARSFVEAYYSLEDTQPDLQVTRIVNGYNDKTVTVTPSTFAPDVPLFPLEASAN